MTQDQGQWSRMSKVLQTRTRNWEFSRVRHHREGDVNVRSSIKCSVCMVV
jgi:hypothetical protein